MPAKLTNRFIAKTLAKKLGKFVSPATLIKVTNTTRTPGAVSGGLNPIETPHACRGWIEEYASDRIEGTTAGREVRQIALLGESIAGGAIPVQGDKVTIEGVTYRITGVPDRDPDAAVYILDVTK